MQKQCIRLVLKMTNSKSNLPIEKTKDGIKLFIRLSPNARQEKISAIDDSAEGACVLKIAVTVVPEKGKANAALIKLLSKKFQIAKSNFEIISGDTNKNKTVLIRTTDVDETFNKLRDLFISEGLLYP